ncbi:MAG: preprotein translocase subunit SecA [Prevotella bivia]|uniref:Protein translocase subunit SecA n=2 Tax=Prevotella bivia TaxID=28125 RepID=I4Z6N5_9BACT|nr:preprotein translocase subunit SecA [Prevotella bivia]EFB93801.1 preprotein translocase, SecA subunit [Prevotella bivia JCVIHMP010]EIM31877.1 preprotein translocase subunit SecA (ATPase, RNA helicase) [Prevotella bivia DSM 20514]KGF24010.1 preprotein translocase subunit SecA [Prevotella bivia DNF00188]KGF45176.1 preprotein translocase subunit SecA [Prevotella bivia DNF00320]KXU59040.1 preprotein translocase, SecA subunit [Prevotella bivia]
MNFNKILKALFGDKSSRDLKLIQPFVDKVKAAYPEIQALSNDELRAKTKEIQQYVQNAGKEQREKITELRATIEETPLEERETIFAQIDKIEKEALDNYETALNEVMPVAFSIVKDTARRFAENEETVVTATDFDRDLAADPTKDFVSIEGDKAYYHNHWTAGGNDLKWEMIHYDVQLFGGTVLHQGKIAEMATGEGKTLVSTLPVFLNALTGNGVHVVTVNDYLAKRDSEWMGPLYEFHGLSVDCIDKTQPNSEERRRAYQADITFGTNNEFGFDYLRDNMATSPADLVQRQHNYAIVDEVDSVLIDDARTPLIISGPVPKGDDQMFEEYQPLVQNLYEVQRKQATELLSEARQKISEGLKMGSSKEASAVLEEGFLALYRSYKALPKNKALIKFLSEEGIKAGMLKTEEYYMANNNREMPKAVEPLYFVTEEKMNSCDLTDRGTAWLAEQVNDAKLFILPDITTELSALEKQKDDKVLTEQEYIDKKDEMMNHYGVQSERVHTLQQLLKAYTMFNKDDEYVVLNGEVKIVDEQTGRIMEGRRWSDGLHQAVEAKEHVKIEAATQTFATITLQNYFRMYHKLAGMTGTASTESGEFWDIYKLDVVEIPTNRPIARHDLEDRVYKTAREKYAAVIEEIEAMRNAGRPTLVGTTSVEISELLSKMLNMRKIPHQVLNAKQHLKEAQIVAEAGRSTDGLGAVTIATNMAGRGTDIKLTQEVKDAGGLAIIGTERHESRRVDRQLRGRAGRQGDPGSSVFYVSLEDKLMRLFGSERIAKVMDRLGFEEGERIESSMISNSIERAQKKVEENNFGIRKRLLEYDDVMNKQRTVIYEKRRHALMGERIGMDISNTIWDRCVSIIDTNNYEGCVEDFLKVMAMECPFTEEDFDTVRREELYEKAFQEAMKNFERKTERIQTVAWPIIKEVYENQGSIYQRIMVPITDGKRVYNIPCDLKEAYETEAKSVVKQFEKSVLLSIIDDDWKENLRQLDELRHSVQNASYEQKDPLLIFKLESVKLWDNMINDLNNRAASVLMRGQIPEMQAEAPIEEAAPEAPTPKYVEQKEEIFDKDQARAAAQDTRETASSANHTPYVAEKTPRPNDPCPCGSGKKFKNCHGRNL